MYDEIKLEGIIRDIRIQNFDPKLKWHGICWIQKYMETEKYIMADLLKLIHHFSVLMVFCSTFSCPILFGCLFLRFKQTMIWCLFLFLHHKFLTGKAVKVDTLPKTLFTFISHMSRGDVYSSINCYLWSHTFNEQYLFKSFESTKLYPHFYNGIHRIN